MGSLNAFAEGIPRHEDHDNEAPRAKRVRLSENAVASIHDQLDDPETSLEVDHMILDYVAYHTIEACLASRGHATQPNFTGLLPSNLLMSNSFIAMFKAKHPNFKPDAEMRFRILLLKFVTLFTQRLTANPTTPSKEELQLMRERNRDRARSWSASTSHESALLDKSTEAFNQELAFAQGYLNRNRSHVLDQLNVPAEDELYEDAHYGTSSCVSLLDLIPTFMQLTAARCSMANGNLTDTLMQLASELMLQACLEQYLVYGAEGSGALVEAFAWGYHENYQDGKEATVNEMFEDQDYEKEVEGWQKFKISHLELLLSSTGTAGETDISEDLAARLEAVAGRYPIAQFETFMLGFLSGLSRSIPEPVLAQLERGCLDSMTEEETAGFIADCGIDVSAFFSAPIGFKGLTC